MGRGRLVRGTVLAAAMMATVAAPVAADTNLVIGGTAVVSYTNNDGVNFRDAVGYSSDVIRGLEEGANVHVIGGPLEADDGSLWYNVDVDGTLGWIVSDYLALASASSGTSVTVVNTDGHGLRLRDAADLGAGTITVIPEGTTVSTVGDEVTDSQGNVWVNVSYNGSTGYAFRTYLAVASGDTAAPAPAESQQVSTSGLQVGGNAEIVDTNGDGLNLRYDIGYNAGVATVANEGDVVHIIGGPLDDSSGNTWWSVDYKGHQGWMYARYLAPTDREATQVGSSTAQSSVSPVAAPVSNTTGDRIASIAMQYLGHAYVWGGTTPAGFDCSGFLYYVVNEAIGGGFTRSLEGQATSGTYVDPDDLRPGDLVFQQNTYQWGLSHAGIYIGNGQFINAANPSVGVVISNLWDSYWGPRYYTARRIS